MKDEYRGSIHPSSFILHPSSSTLHSSPSLRALQSNHFMPTPLLRFARYRDIAREVAERLVAAVGNDPLRAWSEEVIVSSNSVGQAIASELLARVPSGVSGLRLQTLETLAKRILNDAGEYPRVASVAERRLAMRTAVRS